MTDPIAQGTETAPAAAVPTPDSSQAQTQPQNTERHDGLQKRFDQMTAEKHALLGQLAEAQAQANAQAQMVERVLAMQQASAQQPQAPRGPQVPEGMDPSVAQYIQELQAQNARQLEQMVSRVNQTVEQQRVQTLASQHPPDVARRAAELSNAWRSSSKFGNGWEPEDAIRFAYGEKAYADAQKNMATQAVRNFSGGGYAMPAMPAAPPSHAVSSGVAPVPADIHEWPAAKQEEYWTKRVGDVPV